MYQLRAADQRVHRCVWIYSKLARRGHVDYRSYERRFHATQRSYYRDLLLLKNIGVTVQSERDHGRVIFIAEAL